jgi:signal transduction histidine kinase
MIIGISIPAMIVVLGSLITLGYVDNIEERQGFEQIADELKDEALEVRRREKIFLHFKDKQKLDEVHSALSTYKRIVDNIAQDVVKEIGERDIHDLSTSLVSYAQLVEDLYTKFSQEAQLTERVREEGRKLETFVSEGSHPPELTTSFVLHLRLLEKNYMLFRDNTSLTKLTESLALFKDITPICYPCSSYVESILKLVTNYDQSAFITRELQDIGDRMENITTKAALRERQRISAFLTKTKRLLLIALVLISTIGPLFVYKTAAAVVAPINRLAEITRKIAKGDMTVRAPLREHDETYELSQSFNTMLDKLQFTHHSLERSMELLKEKQAQLVESEKRASLGLLVSGVAHELNNPLNNISLIAERIVEDKDELSTQEMKDMNNILSQCDRAKHIVENLLDFARARKSALMEKLDIVEVTRESFNLVGNQLRINNIDLQTAIPGTPLYIEGNRSKLEQIFISIMTNAIQAIQSNGSILVEVTSDVEADTVLVNISDNGPGIPKTEIKHIFEPFYTTKPVGKGTGLGLSVAYSLAKEHNGDIQVRSEDGKGTTFTIILPLYREPPDSVG